MFFSFNQKWCDIYLIAQNIERFLVQYVLLLSRPNLTVESHVLIRMTLRQKMIKNLILYVEPKSQTNTVSICAIIQHISCKINYRIFDICLRKHLGDSELLTVELFFLSHSFSLSQGKRNLMQIMFLYQIDEVVTGNRIHFGKVWPVGFS